MYLSPGQVLAVPFGLVWHVGIVSEPFWPFPFGPLIISSSRRTGWVAEETLEMFSGGKAIVSRGYPSKLPPQIVIARARAKLGEPWDLLTANCEHLVSWAHGLNGGSPTLRAAVAIAAGVTVIGLAASAR